MQIYVAHSTAFDFQKELYAPLLKMQNELKCSFLLPYLNSDQPFSSLEMFQKQEIDLIVAEVSFASTGMGIELGWASSCGIKIICIYQMGKKHSNSLKTVSNHFFEYKNLTAEIKNILMPHLSK